MDTDSPDYRNITDLIDNALKFVARGVQPQVRVFIEARENQGFGRKSDRRF